MEQIKNEKLFFRVFPTLETADRLRPLFGDVEVKKITTGSRRDFLRIYIVSTHIIQKKDIRAIEQEIRRQLFAAGSIRIEIREEFWLSAQYTVDALAKEYRESFLLELKEENLLAANLLAQAEMHAQDNILTVKLEENFVAEKYGEDIRRYLEKVYRERFHRDADVRIQCGKVKSRRWSEQKEEHIQREMQSIFTSSESAAAAAPAGERTAAAEQKTSGPGGKQATGSGAKKGTARAKGQKNSSSRAYTPGRKGYSGRKASPDDPNLIFGRSFDDEPIALEEVEGEMGEITFQGQILTLETREIRNEKTILMFSVTDFTDSISVKMFSANDRLPELLDRIKPGIFVKIKGMTALDRYDGELNVSSVTGIRQIPDFRTKREDFSSTKRVELHCHTKMSDMDGVSDVKDIVRRAHDWGHPAIAVTDHGVAQAFPDANHYVESLPKDDPFKILYGVEGYVVDDLTELAVNAKDQTLDGTFIVFDLETTGFSAIKDKIIEIGAVKVENGEITARFSEFVNPKRPIPYEITKLTSITDDMVIDAPPIEEMLPRFLEFAGDGVLVAHNAGFDVGFIEQNCRYQDIPCDFTYLDTVALARVLLPNLAKYKLDHVAKALGVSLEHHHRAVDDAEATAQIFLKFVQMLKEKDLIALKDINRFGGRNVNAIRKMPTYHIIILAKNDIGRYNLYRLITESHMTYYARRPRIPKSLLCEYREGLLIGSACEAGELYRAVLENRSPERIARLCEFYDYYEIQPIGNNRFMIESSKTPQVNSEEDLKELNREIVRLGEKFRKPVAATCDVHFLDPEDEVYRRIIMAGKGFDDADKQAPLFLRTTEEMLEEFAYLGREKAYEVVVENPNKIARMVEKISPVNPNKCPPVIENSDQELRKICYDRAVQMYGDPLPVQVSERLEKELHSIISNGYAVMYIIAQKLVQDSNEHGYLVGSRGSVGSSLAATMAGITEVNPLSPHYYCASCHYSEFDSAEVKAYAGGCGFDLPDKACPVCGRPLVKAGFDIPFETFLGFKGDKEPDIDLNFSGDYQAKAHRYTEVLFGEGHTFKAGTIGTMAEKTAYGFVKNYFADRGKSKRRCEIDRLTAGCTGVRRSTGQHPGGIVVLPHGHDINEFTPVQHPANDMKCGITTTHFDYHSIDHNLLKLDILGHDDPTMIRALEDYITSDAMDNEYNAQNPFIAQNIPLDDKQVMELFHGTEVLGIKPEDIGGCRLGCLGVPEFGTDFVIQMVEDTRPQTFADLIRISGLSHGTNVWLGNAQELVRSGEATISTAICTRDDIMVYLIGMGVESSQAFTIMESVRKGRGLKPEWEEVMKGHDVPDWYIRSCKKISYMFPKAHAAAYVMMAYRIAYCKINYPLAYYAAYFGIRADAFNYEMMARGPEVLKSYLDDFRRREDKLSKKEEDLLKDMKIVEEMYARGFSFVPLDIYRAKASRFLLVDGKLMPSFNTIEGMGEKAAEAAEEAAKDGKYLSLDDFRDRTKIGKNVVDLMERLGLFGDLPQSNQLSLFDF